MNYKFYIPFKNLILLDLLFLEEERVLEERDLLESELLTVDLLLPDLVLLLLALELLFGLELLFDLTDSDDRVLDPELFLTFDERLFDLELFDLTDSDDRVLDPELFRSLDCPVLNLFVLTELSLVDLVRPVFSRVVSELDLDLLVVTVLFLFLPLLFDCMDRSVFLDLLITSLFCPFPLLINPVLRGSL